MRNLFYPCILFFCLPNFGQLPANPDPLSIGERNPLYNKFYVYRAQPLDLAAEGTWQVHGQLSYSNIFERAGNEAYLQEFDFELTSLRLDLRRGLNRKWELGLSLPFNHYSGGFLDHFIQEYHNAFGLPNDTRDQVPDNRYLFALSSSDGELLFQVPKQSFEVGDLEIYTRFGLGDGTRIGLPLTLKLALKVPSGEDSANLGQTDAAVELAGHKNFQKSRLFLSLAAVFLGRPEVLQDLTRGQAGGFILGFQRSLGKKNLAWSAQLDGGSSYFKNTGLSTLDRGPLNLALGLTGLTRGGQSWQFSLVEDISGDGPSVDFTLHFAMTLYLGPFP